MSFFGFRHMTSRYVKESVDNLPIGVIFFNEEGIAVLCNHRMNQICKSVYGYELQSLNDLKEMLCSSLPETVKPYSDKSIFLIDGVVWQFSIKGIIDKIGRHYTQVIATDISELYQIQNELEKDMQEQERVAERLKNLQKNVVALSREEETLRLKMRIHDDIGRSLVMTKRFLKQGKPMSELNMSMWIDAVTILQRENAGNLRMEKMEEFLREADSLNVHVSIQGNMPTEERVSNVFFAAMRECLTNTVRHADGDEMYVDFENTSGFYQITITNNGIIPKNEIIEGGGLSNLRRQAERYEGIMEIKSTPVFALSVAIPIERGERL